MICYSRNSLLILVLLLLTNIGACRYDCKELRCGRHGPRVRFPFQLKDKEPHHCGYPGFDLTCTDDHKTLLELPTTSGTVKLFVKHIDYQSQMLEVYDPQSCLPRQFLKLRELSVSPFTSESSTLQNITFLNCSAVGYRYLNDQFRFMDFLSTNNFGGYIKPQQDMFSCPIYAVDSSDLFLESDLLSCTKLFDMSSNLYSAQSLQQNSLSLRWLKPNCSRCEEKGMKCKLMNNGTEDDTECLESLDHDPKIPKSTIIVTTGAIVGSIVLVLVLLAFFQIYRYFRLKGEDQVRVEKFLDDYRALKPTRFSYADINRITNRFKDKLGEGAHGAVFKGKLSNEILVAVKILNNNSDSEGDGEEFINEVGTMGKIHHVNVVRLLGFCADGFYRALVYDFFPNGSLQNFISPPDNKDLFVGWDKLQQIALGIAKGIEYLHLGCDHRILHFDINPHNVLLDDNFTPKITDFGLAKLCSKNQSTVSMTAARGTLGYIAPEVFSRNFGNVSYKSDIYSYGMLLVEMVGGRKNTNTSQESFEVLYPEWIHNLVEGGDVHIDIEDEEDIRIARKLAIVGLWCIQWHPVNRPSMKTVVQMLEGDGDKLKVPPTPFDSTASTNTSALIPARPLSLELEVIHELDSPSRSPGISPGSLLVAALGNCPTGSRWHPGRALGSGQ